MTKEEASKLIEDPLYLGVLMIKNGDADGEVSGADHATGDVLRPAFHYVKTSSRNFSSLRSVYNDPS